ncbi:sigma 54-interacting transcriptional regulator [Desulfosporosinus sp. BG]|uniref:sigma 54-interacting transcriptional regulator n=1 Tax=Desulfosporosinus sp. BG TaxID=1633135 RepID=UPI00083A4419|nr:sigma 54-interacting transcriptional regulator [Desulfosporosinus sp. BG]ODA42071.1 Acetoacetate metabolism regulatory protein AtoC [Desulfosporosinus sp. BG]
MGFLERVIQIDFEDRLGLGMEIFERCEKNRVDKIGMEVIPAQGMFIKFRCTSVDQIQRLIRDLEAVKGVHSVKPRDQMPYEEREHELRTILNSVSEGIVAVNKTGKIIQINEVACNIFHCSSEEVIGSKAEELFQENAPILETLKTGLPYRLEEREFKKGNKAIHFLTTGVPVLNAKGQVIGAVATMKDFRQVEEIISKVDRKKQLMSFEGIIYHSAKMRYVIETAKMVAKGNSTVLLRGESGTGKELFARAIHMESLRAQAPFIAINCAALPDSLLESELFGYEEGSFTGATKGGKKGLFEQAEHGTIFLDEIGEIPTQVQVRLLRVLQEGMIRRVGGAKELSVDVRIVAATHRNLEEMIQKGEFREDLYYRLNVIPLRIPALRERREDIPLIAQHLIRKISSKLGKAEIHLTKESSDLVMNQPWPGNVRQLENTLERIINVMDSAEIKPQLFYEWTDLVSIPHTAECEEGNFQIQIPVDKEWPSLKEIVSDVEKQVLIRVLETHSSSRKAGKILGVSNTTILNKMKSYGID